MSLNIDTQALIKMLEELKGNASWREFCRECHVNHSIIYRIKTKKYNPGMMTFMRFATFAPIEQRNDLFNKILTCCMKGD